MTILATEFALFSTQDWAWAGRVVAIGALLDVLRALLDWSLGQPGKTILNNSDQWAGNKRLHRRQTWIIFSILLPLPIGIVLLGMAYSLGAPLEGQEITGVYRVVASLAPDLSPVLQIVRRWGADLRNQGFPEHATVVTSFVSFTFMVAVASVFLTITFTARPFAIMFSIAVGQGPEPFHRSMRGFNILIVYMLFLFLFTIALYNFGSHMNCDLYTGRSKICRHNNVLFSDYSIMYALSMGATIILQYPLELCCHKVSSRYVLTYYASENQNG